MITTLPVTSKPLSNTPEHLTWEAWFMVDSKNPADHEKTRKITPKSIFITPEFTNSSSSCPDGQRLDDRGNCIQVIVINENDLVVNRLQELLASSSDANIEYDYDNYDSKSQEAPVQINIPLSFGSSDKDDYSGDPKDDYDDQEFFRDPPPKPAFNVLPFAADDATSTDTVDSATTTVTSQMTEIATTDGDAAAEGTTEIPIMSNDMETQHPASVLNSDGNDTNPSDTTDLSLQPENDAFKHELEEESFLFDVNDATTLVPPSSALLDNVDGNTEATTDGMTTITTTEENNETILTTDITIDDKLLEATTREIKKKAATKPPKIQTTFDPPAETTVASKEPTSDSSAELEAHASYISQQSITPENKKPTASPSTEKIVIITPQSTPKPHNIEIPNLNVENESNSDKVLRESLEKHEQSESAIENIDTRNRFVYHHLGSDTTKSTPPPQIIVDPTKSSNFVRFPTQHPHHTTHHHPHVHPMVPKGSHIRFPEQSVSSSHKVVPNPESNTSPSWWLPRDWRPPSSDSAAINKHQEEMLLRFWANFPTSTSSTPNWRTSLSNRENSKSPTENLYRDDIISSHDIYKVLGRNADRHHTKR